MTLSRARRFAAAAVGLTMIATSCGAIGGEETVVTRNPALQDAIANEAIFGEAALTIDADVAACIGREAYERIGPERLDALGVTVERPTLGPILEEEGDLVGECRLSAAAVADPNEETPAPTGDAVATGDDADGAETVSEPTPEPESTEAVAEDEADSPEEFVVETARRLTEGPDALTTDPELALCLAQGMADRGPVAVTDTGFPVVFGQDGAGYVELLDQCGFDAESVFVEAVAASSNPVPIEVARCLPTSLESETWRGWLADALVDGDLDPLGDLAWGHVQAVGFISCT